MSKRVPRYKRPSVGCWTCRKRKIKCDAQRPSCKRCEKSNLQCEGYGVKLNWSSPLIIKHNEMKYLDENHEVESFQRSKLELCKWVLYDYYDDIDDDLMEVEKTLENRGPFGVFRYKEVFDKDDIPWFINYKLKESLRFEKTDLFNHTKFINIFISNVALLFHGTDDPPIKTIVQSSIGSFVLTDNDLDLCVILAAITIAYLQTTRQNDPLGTEKIYQLKTKIDMIIKDKAQSVASFHNASFLLILLIAINAKLGIYEESLFQYTTNDIFTNYYEFHKATNILINHTSTFHPKFHKIYRDVLDPNYNLLRNLDQTIGYHIVGKITISNKETPRDQIIRIPKYIEDDTDETVPPSFVIHFQNDEDDEKGDQALSDDLKTGYDGLFDLKTIKRPIFGIHQRLISLYIDCCHLINHSRMFRDEYSRNFPRVVTEFEDLLVRNIPNEINFTARDETFYDFLLYLFYKLVKNYPQKMLSYHWKKINTDNLGLGCIKFVTRNTMNHGTDTIWENTYFFEEWLKNNELTNDEHYEDWKNDHDIFVI